MQVAQALLDVYARVGPLFVAGEGAELIAEDGTRYLDFVAGIGVNALGYNHPVVRAAVEHALATGLIHVSNLYRTEPAERLAEELVARSFADRVFFCNSGAEANEAAFKFARARAACARPRPADPRGARGRPARRRAPAPRARARRARATRRPDRVPGAPPGGRGRHRCRPPPPPHPPPIGRARIYPQATNK